METVDQDADENEDTIKVRLRRILLLPVIINENENADDTHDDTDDVDDDGLNPEDFGTEPQTIKMNAVYFMERLRCIYSTSNNHNNHNMTLPLLLMIANICRNQYCTVHYSS